MRFETCGICEVEYGTKFMTIIDESVVRRIGSSGIGAAYDNMVKVLDEPPTTRNKYAQVFARVVENELYDGQDEYRGLMNGSKYICYICDKHLPVDPQYEEELKNVQNVVIAKNLFDGEALEGRDDENEETAAAAVQNEKENVDIDSTRLKMPPLALVNGYFRGKTPDCLQNLNRVELSMINRINLISHVTMLPGNGHYASNTTVYSILNDIVQVANSLPNKPSVDIVAVIKTIDTELPDAYSYSPYKVMNALDWLKENNENWSDVHLKTSDDDNHVVDRNHNENVPIPCIIANEEDMPTTSFPSSSKSSKSSKSSASSTSLSVSSYSTSRKPNAAKKSKLSPSSSSSIATSTSSTYKTSTSTSTSTSSSSSSSTTSNEHLLTQDDSDEEYNSNDDDNEGHSEDDNSSCGGGGSYDDDDNDPTCSEVCTDEPKGCQDVYLEVSDSLQKPIVTQLRDLIESKLCPMERRTQTRQFAHIRTTPNFLQLAFCSIYPYGKGGPSLDDSYHIKWDRPYIKHTMMLGKIP